jgi:tetratricopeptide (TPR) repeat protein
MKTGNILSNIAAQIGLSASSSRCTDETGVLNYLSAKLDDAEHARMESHLVTCEDCRELLVAAATWQREKGEMSEAAVSGQLERIKHYMAEDAAEHARKAVPSIAEAKEKRARRGFYLNYPQLAAAALVICAIGLGAVFFFTNNPPRDEVALEKLQVAAKDGRRTAGWISAVSEHSTYSATRGPQDRDDLKYELAETAVSGAEAQDARPEEKLALAQIWVAKGNRYDIVKALAVFRQFSRKTSLSAETLAALYNDAGVGEMALDDHQGAIESFDKSLSFVPGVPKTLFNRAYALQRAQKYQEARIAWQEFLNSAADENWKAEARSHLQQLDEPNLK